MVLSVEPGQYTLYLAAIKVDADKLYANNYRSKKYTRMEFTEMLHPSGPTSFEFPLSRLVTLKDQVPESALFQPPMLDANGDPCLIVFKKGAKTGTTISTANDVSSCTRNCRWPVPGVEGVANHSCQTELPYGPDRGDMHSGTFSADGDSGSCVADAFGRVGGIITGGCDATECSDVTYVTPTSFIMKVLHMTKSFEHAHLDPVLA